MISPPCKNCPRRTVGCHDENTCAQWREYVEACQAEKAAKEGQKGDVKDWYRHLARWKVPLGKR